MLATATIFSTLFTSGTVVGCHHHHPRHLYRLLDHYLAVLLINSFGRIDIHPVWFDIIISDLSNACCGDYSFLVIFFLFLLLFRFPVFHPFCLVPITVTIGTVSVFPFIIVYLLMLSILSQLYVHNLQSQLLGGHYNPSLTRL